MQAGAVSVDPKTGKVLALYGGEGLSEHYVNNATRTDYQPASTFKPLILAAALENEATTQSGQNITADTIYDGTSKRPVVDNGEKVGFAPPNEDKKSYGPVTVQTAMNKSINSVFAQLGVDVGMDQVMATAKKLGMDSGDLKPFPAQTLGTMGASPMEMAGVYATLDNHGKKVTPQIVKAVSKQGEPVPLEDAVGEQVISRGAADSVTSVLTGVVDDGTAKTSVRDNPVREGQQVAGKTGTSDDNKSAWFTGYTPDLVTSVGLFGEGALKSSEAACRARVHGGRGRPAACRRRQLPRPDLGAVHLQLVQCEREVRPGHRHGQGRPAHDDRPGHPDRGALDRPDAEQVGDDQPDADPDDAERDADQRDADRRSDGDAPGPDRQPDRELAGGPDRTGERRRERERERQRLTPVTRESRARCGPPRGRPAPPARSWGPGAARTAASG